jgi:hypothetical protein
MSGYIPPLHMSRHPYSFQCRIIVCALLSSNDMSARSKHVPRPISTTSVCLKLQRSAARKWGGGEFLHFLLRRLMATMADIKVGGMCTFKPQT